MVSLVTHTSAKLVRGMALRAAEAKNKEQALLPAPVASDDASSALRVSPESAAVDKALTSGPGELSNAPCPTHQLRHMPAHEVPAKTHGLGTPPAPNGPSLIPGVPPLHSSDSSSPEFHSKRFANGCQQRLPEPGSDADDNSSRMGQTSPDSTGRTSPSSMGQDSSSMAGPSSPHLRAPWDQSSGSGSPAGTGETPEWSPSGVTPGSMGVRTERGGDGSEPLGGGLRPEDEEDTPRFSFGRALSNRLGKLSLNGRSSSKVAALPPQPPIVSALVPPPAAAAATTLPQPLPPSMWAGGRRRMFRSSDPGADMVSPIGMEPSPLHRSGWPTLPRGSMVGGGDGDDGEAAAGAWEHHLTFGGSDDEGDDEALRPPEQEARL